MKIKKLMLIMMMLFANDIWAENDFEKKSLKKDEKERILNIEEMKTLKIGVAASLTGGTATSGISVKNASIIAVEEINKNGGVLGKLLELVIVDDKSNDTEAQKIAHEFVNSDNIIAVIGFCNSGPTLKVVPIYQESQTPIIVTVASSSKITKLYEDEPYNYIFRTALNDDYQGLMMLNDAFKKNGKKIALLSDDSEFGKNARESLINEMNSRKMKFSLDLEFQNNLKSIPKNIVDKVIESNPDIILIEGTGVDKGILVKEIKSKKWKGFFIGNWSMSSKSFIDTAGFYGDDSCMPQSFIQAANTHKRKVFIEQYIQKFNPDFRQIEAPIAAAQAYDAVYLIAQAIEQGKSIQGKDIVKNLEGLHTVYKGLIKDYLHPFNSKNHEALGLNDGVMGMVRNGRVTYAYREDSQKIKNLQDKN